MAMYNIYLLHLMSSSMLILLSQSIMIQGILGVSLGYNEKQPTRSILHLVRLTFINIKGTMTFSTMVLISALIPILNELEESLKLDCVTDWKYQTYILLSMLKVPIVGFMEIQWLLISLVFSHMIIQYSVICTI